jgi:hypothetical protein
MSRKEIARLLDHIEPQGVMTTRTTKGVLLRLPDGESTMLHFSGSDVREAKNVRARLKRSGVSWPTDGGEDLGPRITDHKPLKSTLDKVSTALESWDQRTINASQLVRLMGGVPNASKGQTSNGMTILTAQRALYALGWQPIGKSTARKWLPPLELEPEPIDLTPAPQPEELQLAAHNAPAEPVHIEPHRLSLVPDAAPPAEPVPADGAHPDSWAMAIDQLPNDTSVTQLWLMLAAMGLEGEIRVWRATPTAP